MVGRFGCYKVKNLDYYGEKNTQTHQSFKQVGFELEEKPKNVANKKEDSLTFSFGFLLSLEYSPC